MRPRLAALLLAVMVAGAPMSAVCAHAQAASPFEVIPVEPRPQRSYRAAWITAAAGAGLVALSFPLAHEADRRYELYLGETDVSAIDARFDATTRMDRLASAALLTGEALLATAVWLRFVHRPSASNPVTFEVEPSRCAVSLRF